MTVSIFTDISINPTLKKGGFAFYIGCKIGKIQKAGQLKGDPDNTDESEANCISNAIHYLTAVNYPGVTHVTIYTDSSNIVKEFNGTQSFSHLNRAREAVKNMELFMMEFCLSRGWPIRKYKQAFSIELVKGHTKGDDKLSTINNWCDYESRKYMWKATGKIK